MSTRSERAGRSATASWLAAAAVRRRPPTELAYLDTLAAVDGLVARKAALDERLSRLALEGEWWPTVARLRCFRGIDTLTAFVLCLEIGDFARFQRPAQLASWLGLVPSLDQSGESRRQGAITKTGSGYARRLLVEAAWHYLREPRIGATRRRTASRASPRTCSRSPGAPSTASTASTNASAHAASPATSPPSPSPANSPASSGPPPWPTNPPTTAACSGGRRADCCRHARSIYGQPATATPVPRQRTPATQPGQWGNQPPHHQTDSKRPSSQRPTPTRAAHRTQSTTGRRGLDP